MSEQVVEQPASEQAPLETTELPPQELAAPALNVEDDAAVDAALESSAIDLPDGDKLVTTSQAGKIAGAYRGKIKELKAELESAKTTAAEAASLKDQIAQLQAQLQQHAPYVQAYQAMTQAAQQAAPEDDPETVAELQEIARDFDFYKPDGTLDLDKAKRQQARETKRAQRIAQQEVAPIHLQTATDRSTYNLARAKNTVLPSGVKADPAVLDRIWAQLDPKLTATKEGAQQALMVAIGMTVGLQPAPTQATQQTTQQTRNTQGQFTAQQAPLADPVFTEKAGGRAGGGDVPLSKQEQDYIKAAGITEKQYRDSAQSAPWLRR